MLVIVAILLAQGQADPIIVIGTKSMPIDRAVIARELRTISAMPVEGQIASWRMPICFKAIGVRPDVAARVVSTIKAAALEAEVKVASRSCTTNALITFVDNGPGFIQKLIRRRVGTISFSSPTERDALLDTAGPIRWWYDYETTGADGRAFGTESAAIGANASGTDGIALPDKVGSSYHATLIGTKTNVRIRTASVVIDINAAKGFTLDAVANYAARVILAPVRQPVIASTQSTILTLFEPGAQPQIMTRFDRAYVWANNRLPAERTATAQRGRLVQLIDQRLSDLP